MLPSIIVPTLPVISSNCCRGTHVYVSGGLNMGISLVALFITDGSKSIRIARGVYLFWSFDVKKYVCSICPLVLHIFCQYPHPDDHSETVQHCCRILKPIRLVGCHVRTTFVTSTESRPDSHIGQIVRSQLH